MSEPREPLRLSACASADPELRAALRVLQNDAPNVAVLNAFAAGVERALHEGGGRPVTPAGRQIARHSLASKLAITTIVCAALVYGVMKHTQTAAPLVSAAPAVAASVPTVRALQMAGEGAARRADGAPLPRSEGANARANARANAHRPEPEVVTQDERSAPTAMSLQRAVPIRRRNAATRGDARIRAPDTHQRAVEPSPPASAAPVVDEVELLARAQQLLLTDAQQALRVLAEHRSTFARGAFAQERDVLELEAFQRLNAVQALRDGARVFMQRYPHSAHRVSVDKLLEKSR